MTPRLSLLSLRVVGFLEGISFLLLLLVAMPLKYLAGRPLGVEIVGAIHGGLFVLYVLAVAIAAWKLRWSIYKIFEALLASVIPAGTLYLERRWKKEQFQLS